MVEKLIQILIDSSIQPSGTFYKINGTRVKFDNADKILELVDPGLFKKHDALDFLASPRIEQRSQILKAVETYRNRRAQQLARQTPKTIIDPRKKEVVRAHYRFCYLLQGNGRSMGCVLDTRDYSQTDMSLDIYRLYFSKEELDELLMSAPVIEHKFNPFSGESERLVYSEELGYHIYNTYAAPTYKELIPEATAAMDQRIYDFLKFFTAGSKEEMDNLLLWSYECAHHRAPTFLCLISDPGTGKTSLYSELMHRLVGKDNFTPTKGDFNRNNFNRYLDKTRFVLLDEFECLTDRDKDNLKRIQNDLIQVEGKGQDQRTIRNYCSFIICNNEMEAVKQDPLDRKFYFPKITNKKILTTMGKEFIESFLSAISDDQVLANFYLYLEKVAREHRYSSSELIPKNNWHEQVILATSHMGLKDLVESFLDKKLFVISYEDAKQSYGEGGANNKVYFVGPLKFKRFFKNFTWNGKFIFEVEDTKVFLLDEDGYRYVDKVGSTGGLGE